MVRMNRVLEICEIDMMIDVCCIIKLLVNIGFLLKLCRKVLLNMLVICSFVFSSIEKIKKIVICLFLNSVNVLRFSRVV